MGEINSLEAMQQVLQDNFGVTSCSNGGFRSAGVPTYYPASGRCTYLSPTAQVLCEGGGFGNQLCYCKAATTTSTTRIGTLRIKHGQPYCHIFFVSRRILNMNSSHLDCFGLFQPCQVRRTGIPTFTRFEGNTTPC